MLHAVPRLVPTVPAIAVTFFVRLVNTGVALAQQTPSAGSWMTLQYNVSYGGRMSEGVVYRSKVRIERVKGPIRRAYLPAESQPVVFGVHGAIAEHYRVPPHVLEPHATTLDYIVAATAG